MQACAMAALLLFPAPAEAGWLDRARGLGAGAQVYGQVSVLRSLRQNLGTLTDLFGDMVDAAGDGDGAKVQDVWSDIRQVPGKIVRDAFPVLRLVEGASAALDTAREELEAAKMEIARLVGRAGGIDRLAALAISREERPFYQGAAGILGKAPLPAVQYARGADFRKRPTATSGGDDPAADIRREDSTGPETSAISSGAREDYDEALKTLDRRLNAALGAEAGNDALPGGDYRSRIEALDRRRRELESENRNKRADAAGARQAQKAAETVARDTGARTVRTAAQAKTRKPRDGSKPDEWLSRQIPRADLQTLQGKRKILYVTHKHLPRRYYGKFERKGGQWEWYYILRDDGTGQTATQIYRNSRATYDGARVKNFNWGILVEDGKFSLIKHTRSFYGKRKEFEVMTMVAWTGDGNRKLVHLVLPLHEAVLKDGSRAILLGDSHKKF